MLEIPGFSIDYLAHFYIGNTDWPHHNWYAFRRRVPGALWRFVSYDSEHCLEDVTHDRTGVSDTDTPAELYARLQANPEFRLLFADRVHRHFFNGWCLQRRSGPAWDAAHPERNRPAALYHQRIAEIDPAIVLESARWGDNQRPAQPYTRDGEWLTKPNRLRNTYFPQRSANLLKRLRDLRLYPSALAPELQPARRPRRALVPARNDRAGRDHRSHPRRHGSAPGGQWRGGAWRPSLHERRARDLAEHPGQGPRVGVRRLERSQRGRLPCGRTGRATARDGTDVPSARGSTFEFIELQNASPAPLQMASLPSMESSSPFRLAVCCGQTK